jgi:hypothetical protein
MAMARWLGIAIASALVLAGCGGSTETFPNDAFTIRASSDIGVGAGRLLLGIGDGTGARLGSPEDEIMIAVHPESDPDAVQEAEGVWTWIVPDGVGLYRAAFDFDTAGIWAATVTPAAGDPLEPVLFQVQEDPFAPGIGEPAPLAPTPTLSDMTIEELTTDPEPEPSFYETSLPDAVTSGQPTVLVFSTPAYCRTAACGPLLETVKGVASRHLDVNFIHVEVYTGLTDPDFAPDADHVAPAAGEDWYSLPSEPWVFVIDGDGTITGRFEGVMDASELEEILP